MDQIHPHYFSSISDYFQNGYLWVTLISDEDLVIEQGEGSLRSYTFGKKVITHLVSLQPQNPGFAARAISNRVSSLVLSCVRFLGHGKEE